MFHLLFIVCVYKFPSTLAWWLWHALIVTITVLSSEFICMKLETAEIKFSLGHIIEKGKEYGIKGAQKIIEKGNKAIVARKTEEVSKKKLKKKNEEV